jgi:hypothetical protein
VLVVPLLVERHQAPTALGAHKSLEQAGGIIVQFCTSLLLKERADKLFAARAVVTFLLALFLAQLVVVIVWWRVIPRPARRVEASAEYTAIDEEEEDEEEGEDSDGSEEDDEERRRDVSLDKETLDQLGRSRLISQISFYLAAAFIASAWVVSCDSALFPLHSELIVRPLRRSLSTT